ncbi:MAG TPA: hypothetical protein VG826_16340 [Pirellulales bacterium]|nr:hypothetical protein [Pirellulales bacterium]
MATNPKRLEVLARNEVGEPTNSTRALSDGQIFLGTFEHLIRIEQQ